MIKLWLERGAWASARARRYFSGISAEEIRRVGVIRHAALGDMVLVRPFLSELRRYFPNAEIVLSVVSNYMEGIPYDLVDSVHVTPGNHVNGVSVLSRIKAAREIGSVDILFDLADTTRSRYICFFASAKVRIGMSYNPYLSRLLHDAAVWRSDYVFEAENMLHTLMLLGANLSMPMPFCWGNLTERLVSQEKRILYFPFASTPAKIWPKIHWVSLVRLACDLWPDCKHIVLSGSGATEKAAPQFGPEFEQHPSNLDFAEPLELSSFTEFVKDATLIISNDTGVRNLAIALGVPTIGVFFSTVPYRYWPRTNVHLAAFEPDGNLPSVNSVLGLMEKQLSHA
jgi:ADP-heptose:LPS heptosyltransferase